MKFKVGDKIKVLSGAYIGMGGKIIEIRGEGTYSVQVAVRSVQLVWFTPQQIAKINGDLERKEVNLKAKGDDMMYDLSLSKNTIWQLMVNLKNTLLYYKGAVEKDPDNNELKLLQLERRRAAKDLLDAVADRKEDFEPEFGYLSTVVSDN